MLYRRGNIGFLILNSMYHDITDAEVDFTICKLIDEVETTIKLFQDFGFIHENFFLKKPEHLYLKKK